MDLDLTLQIFNLLLEHPECLIVLSTGICLVPDHECFLSMLHFCLELLVDFHLLHFFQLEVAYLLFEVLFQAFNQFLLLLFRPGFPLAPFAIFHLDKRAR